MAMQNLLAFARFVPITIMQAGRVAGKGLRMSCRDTNCGKKPDGLPTAGYSGGALKIRQTSDMLLSCIAMSDTPVSFNRKLEGLSVLTTEIIEPYKVDMKTAYPEFEIKLSESMAGSCQFTTIGPKAGDSPMDWA